MQQQTNFIEGGTGPLESEVEHSSTLAPVLIPLREYDDMKRLSRLNRLSSLDSFFDENIFCPDEHEEFAEEPVEHHTLLMRCDSSDSYFDNM